jgi:hypothetical protein
MPISRYPCRVCGQSTEGIDAYVICPDCVADFEYDAGGPMAFDRLLPVPPAEPRPSPLSPDEVEARLRHLLDSW